MFAAIAVAGALAWIDAVHYAAHEPIDVGQIGADDLDLRVLEEGQHPVGDGRRVLALVELRVGPYGRALTKRAPGQFTGVYRFPFLPPFVHPRWTLTFRFVARTTAGTPTVREIPVTSSVCVNRVR